MIVDHLNRFAKECAGCAHKENGTAAKILGVALIRSAGIVASAIQGIKFPDSLTLDTENPIGVLVDFGDRLEITRGDVEGG